MHVPLTQVEYQQLRTSKPSSAQAKTLIRNALSNDIVCSIDIEHIGFWNLSAAQAEKYYKDRIVLCGDAAHSMPPAGGFGMNTGLEDAQNLAHKLNLYSLMYKEAGIKQLEEILNAYSDERRSIGKLYINQSIINYQKNLSTAKNLGLDASKLQLADTVVSYLPFSNKSGIMSALKTVGTMHLDLKLWKKKLEEKDLLELNFFDLETNHKLPISFYNKQFTDLVKDLKNIQEFDGNLMKHFSISYSGSSVGTIGSKQLWSFLSTQTDKKLPYILITNLEGANAHCDNAFVLLENGDVFKVLGTEITFKCQDFKNNYLNGKSRYLIVVRSDSYIEKFYAA